MLLATNMTAIDRMIAVGAAIDTTGLETSGGADHKAGDSMDNKLETTRADSESGDHHEGDRQDERDDATGLKASGGADHKDSDSMDDKLETTRADSEPGDHHEGDRQDERDEATGLKASGGADHKDSGNVDNKLETPRADSEPPVFKVSCAAQLYERTAEELFKKCAQVGVTVKAGRSNSKGDLINLLRPLCVEGWRRWCALGKPSNEYLF